MTLFDTIQRGSVDKYANPYTEQVACISSSGRKITYGELDGLARRIGSLVEPHQLVFCLCSNTIGAIAGYVAFLNNDNASLLLDARMSKDSFDSIATAYPPCYIWAPKACRLVRDADSILEVEGYALWKTRLIGTSVADNLAVLLTTSGSVGSPKLVRLSKENLRSNAESIIEYLHLTDKERPVLGLSMSCSYGLSIVNSHLMVGATLLLTEDSFVTPAFWHFANENAFTSYSGVPFAYETIQKLGIWKLPMPSLRTLTQAGGALSPERIRFLNAIFSPRGVKFYVMYGQTEATARMAYLDPDRIETKAGSIGTAIPGGALSLVDESGEEITTPDTIGELVYEGSNVCLGYAEKAEDLMKGDENGRILHTGDLARRDSDGFYYFVGRRTRDIKIFGHRVSLDSVELLLHPILADCACVGDDSHLTVFTTDSGVDEGVVIDRLSTRTTIPRKAFFVRHIEKMPRLESGKVHYESLKTIDGIQSHRG